jgi:SAM-dependent methyltransferase
MNLREYEVMYRREDAYWWYRGMRRIARRFAPEVFAQERSARVLDVGCGTGANLAEMARPGGPSVVGADLSREALGFARARGLGLLAQASAERLPFRSSSFHVVTFHDAIGGIAADERALAECFRVCRPGGCLYLTAAALGWLRGEHDVATGVEHRYSRAELVSKLERAGFVVERVSFANLILLPPIFLARRLRRLRRSARQESHTTSDFHLTPGPINGLLTAVLAFEGWLLSYVSLPAGVTLLVRARKAPFPTR